VVPRWIEIADRYCRLAGNKRILTRHLRARALPSDLSKNPAPEKGPVTGMPAGSDCIGEDLPVGSVAEEIGCS
jgi:hypothetical protein